MPIVAMPASGSLDTESAFNVTPDTRSEHMCNERESRRDSEPAIVPSVLFDQETVREMNWKAVFGF